MSDLYLIAHVVNAQSLETAKVEFEVAMPSGDGWYTNDGRRVWPFAMIRAKIDVEVAIPEGWLDYLAEEAVHFATQNREPDRLQALLATIPEVSKRAIRRR